MHDLQGNITNNSTIARPSKIFFVNFGHKLLQMIQRIQSIYLLLAALVSGCVIFFVPLFVFGEGSYYILDDAIFTAMTVLSAIISLFSIFRYKNRQQQVVSGRINIILNFVLFGLILYMFFGNSSMKEASFGVGTFIPIIAVVLITLANRAIMKDETLVRAADRLR